MRATMILDEIFARTKKDLEQIKAQTSFKELERLVESKFGTETAARKDVKSALKKNEHKINIIAEIKKASPSKGLIRENFNPLSIAKNYATNDAAAISVLCEPHFFKGGLEYLEQIRAQTDVPLLRKDFIFDAYQILQSKLAGADFILLIAKMLDKKELKALFDLAKSLNLEVLFEVHNQKDLDKAFFADAQIIGVNHRDLNDFSMHMSLCEELMPSISKEKIVVAESGLNAQNIKWLDELGVDAFLIGEYLMRQNDEGAALKALTRRA